MESIKGNPHDPTLVIINRLIRWKNLSMDFVTGLPMFTDWKGTSYDSIPADENGTLQAGADNDRPGLAEVTIDVIVQHSDATCAGPPRRIYPWILWLDCLYLRKGTSYNSILVIAYRLTKMVTRLFELDCGYHPRASHEDIDIRSRSKATDELADEMQRKLSA